MRWREEQKRHFQGQIAERANSNKETSTISERVVIKSEAIKTRKETLRTWDTAICDPIYLPLPRRAQLCCRESSNNSLLRTCFFGHKTRSCIIYLISLRRSRSIFLHFPAFVASNFTCLIENPFMTVGNEMEKLLPIYSRKKRVDTDLNGFSSTSSIIEMFAHKSLEIEILIWIHFHVTFFFIFAESERTSERERDD